MTDGTEELMLNYSGNQFSAAGFTFLLFDVLNTKAIYSGWLEPTRLKRKRD